MRVLLNSSVCRPYTLPATRMTVWMSICRLNMQVLGVMV